MKIAFAVLVFIAPVAFAQNPLTDHNRLVYKGLKLAITGAAEKMPEESYAFKPVDTVRSFGQIIGHIADAQYSSCSSVLGTANPRPKVEQTKTSKADLVAALKEAFTYCDKAYATLTDATAAEMVKSMGGEAPKLSALTGNNVHSIEHYGNLVTYLRIKNIVPPTSEPAFMQEMMKK